jgi:hypothetical protein
MVTADHRPPWRKQTPGKTQFVNTYVIDDDDDDVFWIDTSFVVVFLTTTDMRRRCDVNPIVSITSQSSRC